MAKRGTSNHSFVIGVDKPSGMSSHDVVNRCRRVFGERRVGHFGTLDPMASGVLLLGVGPAARLDAYVAEHDKTYLAHIVFGEERNTDDAEGEVTSRATVPVQVADEAFAREILQQFTGSIMQVPPAFSALKRNGQTMYQLARGGQEVELEPRPVEVYAADLVSADENGWQVAFSVSRGTYIRSLARDIGRAVGCGAYLAGLRRTTLSSITLDECVNLDELEAEPLRVLDPVALLGNPAVQVVGNLARYVENGGEIALRRLTPEENEVLAGCSDGALVSVVSDGTLKAIYRLDLSGECLRCACLFQLGVRRG